MFQPPHLSLPRSRHPAHVIGSRVAAELRTIPYLGRHIAYPMYVVNGMVMVDNYVMTMSGVT
jgi:hypothetical protein